MILQRVIRKSPADYLQEKLWKPIGMEYPASWSTDSEEDDFELMQAGINATAIDYAKFGLLFLNGGNWNGKQLVSPQWVIESTKPQSDNVPWRVDADWKQMGGGYGYLWWDFRRKAAIMPSSHQGWAVISSTSSPRGT